MLFGATPVLPVQDSILQKVPTFRFGTRTSPYGVFEFPKKLTLMEHREIAGGDTT